MRVYTVHRRPAPPAADPDVVLVKEGFSWPAFLLPPAWTIWHAQWLGLVVYLMGAFALAALAIWLDPLGQGVLYLGYHLLIGVSANDWRRGRLQRAGYRLSDVIAAGTLSEAELKLFGAAADIPRQVEPQLVAAPKRTPAAVRRPEPAAPLAPWSP